MLISIGTTSKTLPAIMGSQYEKLTSDKENGLYKFTIQNLGTHDIYIENGETATIEAGYKLKVGNEVEILSKNINKLNLISDGGINTNIRVITT